MKDLRIMRRLVCLISLASVWAAAPARADVITQWNEQVFALGGASRTLAMVHVAMFDAFNAIQPRYQPYPSTSSSTRWRAPRSCRSVCRIRRPGAVATRPGGAAERNTCIVVGVAARWRR